MCIVNSKADPTNTGASRRRVIRWMREAKKSALAEIKIYVDSIPVTSKDIPDTVVTNRRVYLYELNDTDPYIAIREIIERWFGTRGDQPYQRWFFGQEVENVVRYATVTEAERINSLSQIAGLGEPYQVQSILLSQPYFDRISRLSQRAFEEMKGFTGDTAKDLARILSSEMAAGRGITTVKRVITERFDVSMSRAERIARTELGHSHRQAREDQTKDARDRLGLDTFDQWVSALAQTTRPSHAKRHLKFYTPEENAAFYASPESQGGEINCLCVQQTVIRTKDGQLIGARKMTKRDKRLVDGIVAANS